MISDAPQPPDAAAPRDMPQPAPALHPDIAFSEARIWQRLLDAGAIPNRNPPPAPEVAAIRDANDALFRGFARRHCGPW
jgi:hypothetical protein